MNCVIIGSDNGLSPVSCQAITWTKTYLLSIGPSGINYDKIWSKYGISTHKMHVKVSLGNVSHFVLGFSIVHHYGDVIMGAIAYQITSLTVVYSTVYSDADQRKHQSSLAFVREIHRGTVNSPHKWPVTRKMFPFDDIIMYDLGKWYHLYRHHKKARTPNFPFYVEYNAGIKSSFNDRVMQRKILAPLLRVLCLDVTFLNAHSLECTLLRPQKSVVNS